ncbi:hypothetical protein [Streptomyces ziwulingensis]|uniref:Serine/threonine protein kinase n=1 Tax=Streptomyces ziwulingensis TaxID=1045501 RepID=A0ABP9AWR8_9ACTN
MGPEPEPRPETEPQPEPQPEPEPEPERPSRPSRRGRTARLIGAAAALGLLAGACAGYLVQAEREPTRLPSLSQPTLPQARGNGPEPLSAAADRRVKTDGDLRELLLKKPRGAEDIAWLAGDDGWMDLAAYADSYTQPGAAFGELVTDEFRRAAVVAWKAGDDYTVEIRLIQFRQEETAAAAERNDEAQSWADRSEDVESWPLPGTGDGKAYLQRTPGTEDGYGAVYSAEAHAWRGDITMEMWIYGTERVDKKTIMDLAERQMERL